MDQFLGGLFETGQPLPGRKPRRAASPDNLIRETFWAGTAEYLPPEALHAEDASLQAAHRVEDHGLELSDIAREVVGFQEENQLLWDGRHPPAEPLGGLPDEVG